MVSTTPDTHTGDNSIEPTQSAQYRIICYHDSTPKTEAALRQLDAALLQYCTEHKAPEQLTQYPDHSAFFDATAQRQMRGSVPFNLEYGVTVHLYSRNANEPLYMACIGGEDAVRKFYNAVASQYSAVSEPIFLSHWGL